MRRISIVFVVAIAMVAAIGLAAQAPMAGPYKIVKTAKVGGLGSWDYVYAESEGRRLYIPRTGQTGARISVYNLDTLESVGEIPNINARGVAVDPKSGHGFASSNPVAMFDTKTLTLIKTIDVGTTARPDGILFDPFNQHVWILSHAEPNATVIDTKDGSIVGTVNFGGQPEQAQSDGNGHLYVDLEDKNQIAAVDTKTLTVTAHYDITGCDGPGGLGFDAKNHILFASCHNNVMAIASSTDGKVLTTLPIGQGTDGALFNPSTMEAFSSNGDGTLSIIKENSPTSFVVEQDVATQSGARTSSLDSKTGRVFLITAEFGPPPAPATPPATPPAGGGGRGGRRGPMLPDSFTILVAGK
jgi:DNA-binding beta-propeller fold protein YncE